MRYADADKLVKASSLQLYAKFIITKLFPRVIHCLFINLAPPTEVCGL